MTRRTYASGRPPHNVLSKFSNFQQTATGGISEQLWNFIQTDRKLCNALVQPRQTKDLSAVLFVMYWFWPLLHDSYVRNIAHEKNHCQFDTLKSDVRAFNLLDKECDTLLEKLEQLSNSLKDMAVFDKAVKPAWNNDKPAWNNDNVYDPFVTGLGIYIRTNNGQILSNDTNP